METCTRSILSISQQETSRLRGLSESQRKASKKPRQWIDGQAQHDEEHQQQSTLQALDTHGTHNRPMRSTVAQLHRPPMIGAAGEIETRKDEPKTGVARRKKQLTPNLEDGDGEAARVSHVTDVRTHRQKMDTAKQSPKLPTMKVADSSQENKMPEKKKRKKRNRGLKKQKVPRFATFPHFQSFLAMMDSRLTIQRAKLLTENQTTDNGLCSVTGSQEQHQRANHKRMAKTTAAMQRQYDALTSRFFRALKEWDDWKILRMEIYDEVVQWIFFTEGEQFELEETSWTLQKKISYGARSNKWRSKRLPQILDYYQVFNLEDLAHFERERIMYIERIMNGEEGLYHRL